MTDTNDRLEEAKALLPSEFERKHFKNVVISLSLFEWFIQEVEKLQDDLSDVKLQLDEAKQKIEELRDKLSIAENLPLGRKRHEPHLLFRDYSDGHFTL